MINKETIQTLTEEWLSGNDYFLVDINFGALQFLDGLFHCVDLIVGDATFTHFLDMTAQTLYEAATFLNLNLYCL